MNKKELEQEIKIAKNKLLFENEEPLKYYWRFYIHGIKRLYYDKQYGSKSLHKFRMDLINSEILKYKYAGIGYKLGFNYDKINLSNKDCNKVFYTESLPQIRVTQETRRAFDLICEKKEKNLRQVRREAYDEYILQHLTNRKDT